MKISLRDTVSIVVDTANLASDLAHDRIGDLKALFRAKDLISAYKDVFGSVKSLWAEFVLLDDELRSQLEDIVDARLLQIDAGDSEAVKRVIKAVIELSASLGMLVKK